MSRQPFLHRRFIFLTLIVWLCAIWGGLHGHLCFDGQEAPVSVHMDVLVGHPDHLHDDEVHTDADTELLESILNFTKLDLPLLITALICAVLICNFRQLLSRLPHQTPAGNIVFLYPPLRAPPASFR